MKKVEKSSDSIQDSQNEFTGLNKNSKKVTVLSNNLLWVDINLVELDPLVKELSMPKNLNGLKLTMNLVGQIEAIKVRRKGKMYKLFDGNSRYLIAKELGWDSILVQIFDYSDEVIQDRFVLHNFHTKRSLMELCRQAEVILKVLGLSQGKRREKIGDVSLGDTEFGLAGKDRFEIACEIIKPGMSASSLRRLLEVKNFEENGDEEVKGFGLMEKLENGEMKTHQALNVVKNYKNAKKEQGSNALTEAMAFIKGKNYKLFNKSCENLEDISDESIDCTTVSAPYFQQRDYPDGVRDLGQPQHGMERTVDEYVQKEVDIYRGVYKKSKKTGSLFIVIADSYEGLVNCLVVEKLILEMVKSGWFLNQKIYWLKDNQKPQNDRANRLLPTYEYILHFIKDPKLVFYREFKIWKEGGLYEVNRGSKDSGFGHKMKTHTWTLKKPLVRFRNFLSEQRVKEVIHANGFNWSELKDIDPTFRHLAPFPSIIPLLPILLTTKIGDTVLDIYNGTSTTTAVALQLGRKVIGYDTDTETHLFAAKRLQMVEDNLPDIGEVIEFENEFLIESLKLKESDSNSSDRQVA
jgi:DNA modification methylase